MKKIFSLVISIFLITFIHLNTIKLSAETLKNYGVDILLTNKYKEYDIIIPLKQVGDKPSMYAVNRNDRTQNLVVFHIRDTGELDLVMKGMHEYTIDENLIDSVRNFVSNDISDKLLRPIPAKVDLSEAV